MPFEIIDLGVGLASEDTLELVEANTDRIPTSPRQEDGHGSVDTDPSFVEVTNGAGAPIPVAGDISVLSPTGAHTDKDPFVEGVDDFSVSGGVVNDLPVLDPTEDTAAAARITPKRAFHVNLRDSDGDEITVGGDAVVLDAGNSGTAIAVTLATPYIGTARDLFANGGWQGITINIDQTPAGTQGNYFFEFGDDGVSWPVSIETELTGQPFVLPLPLATVRRYFRVRVTTDGGATPFTVNLATLLHRTAPADLTQLPHQAMSDTTPLKNVRALIHGERPDGTFANAGLNEGNALLTADFLTDVASGDVAGFAPYHGVGRNPDVDTGSTPETIWNNGGLYTFPTAPAVVSLVSSSVLDTAAGTGAQTVRVDGLDATGAAQSESVNLLGLVPVLTTGVYSRVNRVTVTAAGATGSNQGTITGTIGATTICAITAGTNVSQLGLYSVATGKTALLYRVSLGMTRASGAAEVALRFRMAPTDPFLEMDLFGYDASGFERNYTPPRAFAAGSDFTFRVTQVTNNNTVISCGFDLVLVDD